MKVETRIMSREEAAIARAEIANQELAEVMMRINDAFAEAAQELGAAWADMSEEATQ